MALTFPLPLAEFFDLLPIVNITFDAPAVVEQSQTAAGEVLRRHLGPALWQGAITIAAGYREERRMVDALLRAVSAPGASFLITDRSYAGPREDPGGSGMGSATPYLEDVFGNERIRIYDLPDGYRVSRGDYVAFEYGSGPTRHALHQLLEDGTANNQGRLFNLQVWPSVRPGWSQGAPVQLIRPVCKAVIVPGSIQEAVYDGVAMRGTSFRWQQTLR